MTSPGSGRKCPTLEQKLLLIKEVGKGGQKKTDAAKKFGIPLSTLSTVLKNKEAVLDGFEKSFLVKRKRNHSSKYPKYRKCTSTVAEKCQECKSPRR